MKDEIVNCNELDYSKDSTIDSRILKICEDAEKTYVYNKSLQISQRNHNLEQMEDYHSKQMTNQMQTISSFSKSPHQEIYCSPSSVYNNPGHSQSDMRFETKGVPHIEYNHLSFPKDAFNSYQTIKNSNNNQTIEKAKQDNDIKQKEFIEKYNSSIETDPNLFKENPFNNTRNAIKQTNQSSDHLILNKMKHKDNNRIKQSNCLHCLMKIRIEQRLNHPYPHLSHIQFKQGTDINKILLDAKTEMKKFHFNKAYNMLQMQIKRGYYHSDFFYLYGEVCRLIKKLNEAEDYLLLCVNFEHHSPYAYYSLGLLYQEISQFKYSNSFFKIFIKHYDTSDARFQMAKNYAELNKYLKSADNLTKSIEKNPECIEYYLFRSDIYKLIGLTELSNDDLNMIHIIKANQDNY